MIGVSKVGSRISSMLEQKNLAIELLGSSISSSITGIQRSRGMITLGNWALLARICGIPINPETGAIVKPITQDQRKLLSSIMGMRGEIITLGDWILLARMCKIPIDPETGEIVEPITRYQRKSLYSIATMRCWRDKALLSEGVYDRAMRYSKVENSGGALLYLICKFQLLKLNEIASDQMS